MRNTEKLQFTCKETFKKSIGNNKKLLIRKNAFDIASHLTWQVHGHQTNITATITWTPLAISSDYSSYYTA